MDDHRSRSFRTLLVALGIDNFGSGLFLPITMLYLVRVVGIEVGVAGVLAAGGAIVGLSVPALVSRVVDTVGPKILVVGSQGIQALGMLAFLVAGGPVLATAGAVLSVAGLQLFYSSMSSLVVDVVADGPKDHPFALVTRVRGASFGLGALAGGALASLGNPDWMRAGVAFNIVTFVLALSLLSFGIHARTHPHSDGKPRPTETPARVLSSRPFLGLMVVAFCTTLPIDFFLSGNAIYITEHLAMDAWVIGFSVALLTAVSSIFGTHAVRLTNRFTRTTTQTIAVLLLLAWTSVSAAALYLPEGGRTVVLLVLAVLIALANVVPMARLAAMAEATAPAGHKGRFLAVFQYPFSIAQVVGPGLTSLLAIAGWVPWAIIAALLAVALVVLVWLRSALPYAAVHVDGGSVPSTTHA